MRFHSDVRYWHRSLNPKKLVEVQFSAIHRNMTLQRMMRLYRLPDVRNKLCFCSVIFTCELIIAMIIAHG